jgi:hypothetical protein
MNSLLFLHHHSPSIELIEIVVLWLLNDIKLFPALDHVHGGNGLTFSNSISKSNLPALISTRAYYIT